VRDFALRDAGTSGEIAACIASTRSVIPVVASTTSRPAPRRSVAGFLRWVDTARYYAA